MEIRNLDFAYLAGTPRATPALRGISLTIKEGERVAILGAARSGKSTLAQAMAGLIRLPPNSVFFRGEDITRRDFGRGRLRASLGLLFQDAGAQVIEDIVGKDIAFGPTNAGVSAELTRQRVEESLNAVGLPYAEYRLRYTQTLSGGELRRVALAGILAMRTSALILDEPAAGLDPIGQETVMDVLRRLTGDPHRTLIVCSSGLTHAALLCDRIIGLRDGGVELDSALEDALRQPDRLAALDISLPEVVRLARDLQPLFPDLSVGILTVEDLVAELLPRLGGGR